MAPINPTPTPTPIPTLEFLLCLISTPPPSSMATTSAAAPSSCKFNKRLKRTPTTPRVSEKQDPKPPECDHENDAIIMNRKEEGVSSTDGTSHDSLSKEKNIVMRYKECRKNHAASIGGHAVDGCLEFMAAGEEGTPAGFECAACGCHRNFHRKEVDQSQSGDCYCDFSSISATTKN